MKGRGPKSGMTIVNLIMNGWKSVSTLNLTLDEVGKERQNSKEEKKEHDFQGLTMKNG